ncbi:cyclophilin-like fold protein [Actinomycetota bacterium]
MSHGRVTGALAPLWMLLAGTACASTVDNGAGSTGTQTVQSASPSESTAPTQTAGTSAPSATTGAEMTELTLTIGGRTIPIELDDSATARDLAAWLPLSLTFSDFGGQEKTATLPAAPTMDGVPAGADPTADEIGYYAPNRVLVLYYEDIGYFDGIVRLGRMSAEDMRFVREEPDGFVAELATG